MLLLHREQAACAKVQAHRQSSHHGLGENPRLRTQLERSAVGVRRYWLEGMLSVWRAEGLSLEM